MPWLSQLRALADQPPRRPRMALCWESNVIGSVEPGVAHALGASSAWQQRARAGDDALLVQGDLTSGLAQLAFALRGAGLVRAWRDEQLAVRDAQGRMLGTVERGVVRLLGIATHAVHLLGFSPDGRHWVQQRALDKPNDPGLWDTLVGGMVPASDTLQQALARETWEEAGVRLDQLQALRHRGQVHLRGPSSEVDAGYAIEHLDWYSCVLPDGVAPANQDGEVLQFRLMDARQLWAHVARGEVTKDASLLFGEAGLQPG